MLLGHVAADDHLVQQDLDVDLVIRAVDAAGVVDGVGEHLAPAAREFDPTQLGQTQIAAFPHHLAAQFVAVDAHCVVGAVADLGIVFPPGLDVSADAAVPQEIHRRFQQVANQFIGR